LSAERLDASSASPDAAPAGLDEILASVADLVVEVVGEDYELGIEVTMDTSFADDLELESIEFVRLGEKLQDRYGDRVDFVGWFAELDVDEIIGLTVGELVTFIASCLDGRG